MEEKQNLSKIVNCSHLIVFRNTYIHVHMYYIHMCEIKKYTRFLEEIHLVYSVILRTTHVKTRKRTVVVEGSATLKHM